MTLYPIETGNFKLDGGAMFGVVPKSLWQRTNPADAKNMIDMAARCLLIEDGDRLILIDTGMGDKQSDKFFGYYYRWGDFSLDGSLGKHGFNRDDITDIFLTHLHFDHCGGCIQWNQDRTGYEPAFKNATFWTNEDHWEWAIHPNAREKASFLEENLLPMHKSGQLKFCRRPADSTTPGVRGERKSTTNDGKRDASGSKSRHKIAQNDMDDNGIGHQVSRQRESRFIKNSELGFGMLFVDGHTDKQMLPYIDYQGKKLVFVADLLPTVGHIPVPYVMGFDTRPLLTLKEKTDFLDQAVENGYYLFFEHDAHNEICTLQRTEKGVRLKEVHTFNELFS